MNGLKNSFSNIPYAFVFLFFSSVGIFQLYQGPLEDPTPSTEVDAGLYPSGGHQKIKAKIWEDPFEAAHAALSSDKSLKYTTTPFYLFEGVMSKINDSWLTPDGKRHFRRTCANDCLKLLKGKIHFYTIPLFVDGWSTTQETRIKRRYAAHMALYRDGFIPAQSSAIHSLCLSSKTRMKNNRLDINYRYSCKAHEYIHYEILTKPVKNALPEVAVLLWARSAQVSKNPGQFFQSLSSQIFGITKQLIGTDVTEQTVAELFDFVAFWPPSSGGLLQVKSLFGQPSVANDKPEISFRLINYSATAAQTAILPQDYSKRNELVRGKIDYTMPLKGFNDVNLKLTYETAIADDSMVLEKLLAELFKQRGFSADHSTFVLVTEWESIYSRKMAEEFKRLCEKSLSKSGEKSHCNTLQFPYISGISGDAKHALDSAKIQTKSDTPGQSSSEIRLPIGSSQYDYVRRLAHNFNQKLVAKRNTVFALFGSNLDDKLLLLQAIRESNKESTIITTDANAVYASLTRKFPIRNLLIGSSYPLESDEDDSLINGQSFSPTYFRDNYQTSLFKAIRHSLSNTLDEFHKKENLASKIQLYEVAKNGFIRLDSPTSSQQFGIDGWTMDHWSLLKNILLPAFMVLLLFVTVRMRSKIHLHAEFNRPGAISAFERTVLKSFGADIPILKKLGAVLVVYAMFFSLIFVVLALMGGFTTESAQLFSGVSIWISEIGRALAIMVILFSVTVSWTKLKQWRNRVSVRYMNLTTPKTTTDWNPFVFTSNGFLSKEKDHIFNRIQFEKSWPFFRNELTARNVFIKAFYILILFACIWLWVAYNQYGGTGHLPAHPIARGEVAAFYDRFFAGLSTVLVTLHIAYVIVITYVCGRLVSHLSRGIVHWPSVYIDKLSHEYQKDKDTIRCFYSEYQSIRLIGRITHTVGPQVVIPFVALFLIMVTRNSYFDNWNYPIGILSFFSVSGVFLLLCAVWLRRLAARAKRNALERLVIQKTRHIDNSAELKNVEYVTQLIHDYKKGAFSGWKDNPVFAAIMLPISSLIGINVIPW